MTVERFVGLEEARPVLGQLAEDAATGDEVWLTKHGKPLAVLLSRDAYLQLRQAAARAGGTMHTMVVQMSIDPSHTDAATRHFREDIVRWARQQPGFVSGQ